MPLMPCFEPGQGEEQGRIIGKILVGYGELEVGLLSCLVAVERHVDLPVKRLVRTDARREAHQASPPGWKPR